MFVRLTSFLVLLTSASLSFGFDNSRNDNVAVYWGQNSYGATHTSDTANWQQKLAFYCQDDSIDAFPIAFLNVAFSTGNLPSIDLANICNVNDDPVFAGTNLPNCSFLASDITTCQSKGKIVTISIGGATGAVSFTSQSQAQGFADTIWNTFLGGSSSTRPFGSAVLDGVDLDLEGGSSSFWPDFITQIRSHASGASKQYYVTGAPQCPFPDAYMGSIINAVGFDAVYVQFYNNYCGLGNFNNPNDWNFDQWDTWAKTVSPNPNVKVYIGAPASSTAAGSGYVDVGTLGSIAQATRNQYSSFGGVMLWDASQAYENGRYDAAIKQALASGGSGGSTTTSTTSTTMTTTSKPATTSTSTSSAPSTTTTAPSSGSCGVVAAWQRNIAGGDQVTYSGHLWTAKWWSYGDVPGGTAGDWTDDGPCASVKVAKTNYRTAVAHASIPTTAQTGPAPVPTIVVT
ncbi:glycoside hydrolase family 18 protein [Heterobasidion irregulare TC 32-1]|uniref:chitinase n=1 Tax=Heterobasidion irregulare (strain TC 32-1) TaxID=747525 RepID=W4KDV7_HETIT|nr:glycoside hydrolase family 18 protein [Heterobasidion irregulare TC 32-1]ETW83246.1 glycoside hydrolase family 18 protein [Heterobasidion irregulare TC 32-1]